MFFTQTTKSKKENAATKPPWLVSASNHRCSSTSYPQNTITRPALVLSVLLESWELNTKFIVCWLPHKAGKTHKVDASLFAALQKRMWVVVCRLSSYGEVVWKSQMTVANVDSHTATWSYHLIPTKSQRVPVNDGVPAGWNTNTPPASPNNRGETAPALPRTYCLSCLVRVQNLINRAVCLIHLNVTFRECEIIKGL